MFVNAIQICDDEMNCITETTTKHENIFLVKCRNLKSASGNIALISSLV